jgi:hypothetical protein
MWRYNFRNGPNYPWREDNAHVVIEPVQSHTESFNVPSASTSSQLESTQELVYDHLDVRIDSASYLRTTRNESAVSCFELEDSDIMTSLNMSHGMDRAPFTGSTTSGPTLAHLEQDFQALKSKIKLKNATNLNANDMFNFIGKMLTGEPRINSLLSVVNLMRKSCGSRTPLLARYMIATRLPMIKLRLDGMP